MKVNLCLAWTLLLETNVLAQGISEDKAGKRYLLCFGRFDGSSEVEAEQRRGEEGLQTPGSAVLCIWKWRTLLSHLAPRKVIINTSPRACLGNPFHQVLAGPPVLSP